MKKSFDEINDKTITGWSYLKTHPVILFLVCFVACGVFGILCFILPWLILPLAICAVVAFLISFSVWVFNSDWDL